MTSVEIQAYSVDEAVRLALEQLGLGEQDVDIEILSDAGPDEGDEALVRVTAKGMASQPIPRGARAGQSAGATGRGSWTGAGEGASPARGAARAGRPAVVPWGAAPRTASAAA